MRTLKWEYTIVANGLLSVEACRSVNFDADLMDIEMPELNGIDASRNIRTFNIKIPIMQLQHTLVSKIKIIVPMPE